MSAEETPEEIPTVLVTGASGFIATHVIQQLLRTGYNVRGTVRSLKDQQKIQAIWDVCPGPRACNRLLLVQADLLDERCWVNAAEGCTYVLHLASPTPFVTEEPVNENEFTKPAVRGTLSILKACAKSTTVKRVVMTSDALAMSGALRGGDYTEDNWADSTQDYVGAYAKSKILAEKAAWDFVKGLEEESAFELVVLNPGHTIGPVLCGTLPWSLELGTAMLTRTTPLIPKISFPIADVRDVAAAHLRAMTSSVAPGKRILISAGNLWYREMAQICEDEFGPHGYVVMTQEAADWLVKFGGWFSPESKFYTSGLSKVTHYENRRMRRLLGIAPMDMPRSVIDMCYSLIDRGFVPKTELYTGRK